MYAQICNAVKKRINGLPARRRSRVRPGNSLPFDLSFGPTIHLVFCFTLLSLLAAASSCSPARDSGDTDGAVTDSSDRNGVQVEGAPAEGHSGTGTSGVATRQVHPEFDITFEELENILSQEPEPVRRAVRARPEYFLELVDRTLDLPEELYVLVDKSHALPESYRPSDLVELAAYPRIRINRDSLELSALCMPDLLAMNEAARADGVSLVLSSAFRSYSYQKSLYEGYVAKHGKEEANRFSAVPGTSQHQLGTAIDFGSITERIASTPQGEWLAEHAWEYGFSLSYPKGMEETTGYKWEPWHFRYVSRTVARLEQEFFDGVQQHMTEFLHRHEKQLREEGL